MKRTFLFSILTVVSATLMPQVATSQIFHRPHPHKPAPPEEGETAYKYEAYAGFGYTSLNQVNQSRSGLMGANLSITRDWGKYFGLTADGAFYSYATANPVVTSSTAKPTVDTVLFGPVFHANLYGRTSGFVHALIGGEHTGGESMTPNISFAGGAGGGLEYKLTPRLAIRASGDAIAASFSVTGNSAALGYSPHMTRDARATVGVVYRF